MCDPLRTSILAIACAACAGSDPPPLVLAAASTQAVVRGALGDDARVSAGPTSTVVHQVEQGAPAAVLISVDPRWTDRLRGPALEVRVVARNRLVLAAPEGSAPPSPEALRSADCVVIGDPEVVPLGAYTRDALRALGLWEAVAARTRPAGDALAAAASLAASTCPVGVLYATDASREGLVAGAPLPGAASVPVEVATLAPEGRALAARLADFTSWREAGFDPP